jgi:hypothetical protein
MNDEQQPKTESGNQKRKTIKIKVPPKPAAPRHPTAIPARGTSIGSTRTHSASAAALHKPVWPEFVLFPFRIYMLLAPIALFVWHELILGNRAQMAFADAAQRVVLGYLVCITAFMLAAAYCFVAHRRDRVLENLALGGIAFLITYFILPWCAGS